MITPISVATAGHYTWGAACDGWYLLEQQRVSVIQERVPAGESEVTHHHAASFQFFYILHGEAAMVIKGERVPLREGQGLEVPPGVPHQFRNDSDGEVSFLVISAPPSHGDRVIDNG